VQSLDPISPHFCTDSSGKFASFAVYRHHRFGSKHLRPVNDLGTATGSVQSGSRKTGTRRPDSLSRNTPIRTALEHVPSDRDPTGIIPRNYHLVRAAAQRTAMLAELREVPVKSSVAVLVVSTPDRQLYPTKNHWEIARKTRFYTPAARYDARSFREQQYTSRLA